MNTLRGAVVLLLLVVNLAFWGLPVLLAGLLKVLFRGEPRRRLTLVAAFLASKWVGVNNALFDALLPTRWDVQGADDLALAYDGHYLIIANHLSWTDIFVVLRVFHRRVSFIRFFLKQELIWVPIVGQACWALDFPFMKRYSVEYLARHPEKRGRDLLTTRRACRRFRRLPVAILNFIEGTRFSEEKREEQQSPYRFLLRPRVGGIAFVLASLGDLLDGVVDVTITYAGQEASAWDFVCGRVATITARARRIEVPAEFLEAAILEPGPQRERFRTWIEAIWAEKDSIIVYETLR